MYIHTTVVCVLCMMYNNHTTRTHLHYPQGGDGGDDGDGGDSSKSILAEELRSFGVSFRDLNCKWLVYGANLDKLVDIT